MSQSTPQMYMYHLCLVWLWAARLLADPSASSEEERGVVFNRLKTVLLAERYAPVQFVVPFPVYAQNVSLRLEEAATALERLWNMPTFDCDLLQISTINDNLTSQLIRDAFTENDLALAEIAELRAEVGLLLPARATDTEPRDRSKRFVPVIAGLAAAGVLGLGLGAALGSGCFLHGVLGSCPEEEIAANAASIRDTMQEMNLQRKHWFELQDELDEKFYLIGDSVTELHLRQEDIATHSAEFWNTLLIIRSRLLALRFLNHSIQNGIGARRVRLSKVVRSYSFQTIQVMILP